jgi:hypothetical protein
MSETNKAGLPVKNASYWRKQHKLAEEERNEAEEACADLMELNDKLKAQLARCAEEWLVIWQHFCDNHHDSKRGFEDTKGCYSLADAVRAKREN